MKRPNDQRNRAATIPCPACGSHQSRTTDVRWAEEGHVRRRKECQCGYRFTTYETLAGLRPIDFQI